MKKRSKTRYSSDLTEREWRLLEPLIPLEKPGGRPRSHPMREIFNAIFYRLKNGCVWRDLPSEFPPPSTVYEYYRAWSLDGTWQRIHDELRDKLRLSRGKLPQPSAGIMDSQSVKTAQKGGLVDMMPPRRLKAGKGTFW